MGVARAAEIGVIWESYPGFKYEQLARMNSTDFGTWTKRAYQCAAKKQLLLTQAMSAAAGSEEGRRGYLSGLQSQVDGTAFDSEEVKQKRLEEEGRKGREEAKQNMEARGR